MDGTLTCSIHDFDGFKNQIGLPSDQSILEGIHSLPLQQQADAQRQLVAWEKALALKATPSKGSAKLLETLLKNDCQIGIVTRNTKDLAQLTLKACGLDVYFKEKFIIGRHCTLPKPNPAGCKHLLSSWQIHHSESIMIGDHLYDIQAGQNAGMRTIYLGKESEASEIADLSIDTLEKLLS